MKATVVCAVGLVVALPLAAIVRAAEVSPAEKAVHEGSAAMAASNWDLALKRFSEAVALDPNNAKAFFGRGAVHANRNDYDKAIADYSEAIRLDPRSADAFGGRSLAWSQEGEFERAIADASNAIRLDARFAGGYYCRGVAHAAKREFDEAIADYSQAARLAPRDALNLMNRSLAYWRKGDLDRAINDIDAAIRLKPRLPFYYEVRAAVRLGRQDYDGAIADFDTEIRLNPVDRAARFEPWAKAQLAKGDLEHGRRQLYEMLMDRPPMAGYGQAAGTLYQWAGRKFAGEDLRENIYWEDIEPTPAFSAETHWATPAEPARIRLRSKYGEGANKGKPRSFEEMWSDAVFELYNACNGEEAHRIGIEAAQGKLSREEFVRRMFATESHAEERTRAFYIRVYLPWAKEHHVRLGDPTRWKVAHVFDRAENFARSSAMRNRRDDYWRRYESNYDWIRATPPPAAGKPPTEEQRAAAHRAWAVAHRRNRQAEDTADRPIRPLDVLMIRCTGTPPNQPIDSMYLVEPSGQVLLGPSYGRVGLEGQTPEQAEATVQEQLSVTLSHAVVELTAFGHARWQFAEPKTPYGIAPNDRLRILVYGTPAEHPIDGEFVVGSNGTVSFGWKYRSVSVKGLDPQDAEQAIAEKLKETLSHPAVEVSVTLSGWETDRYLPADRGSPK